MISDPMHGEGLHSRKNWRTAVSVRVQDGTTLEAFVFGRDKEQAEAHSNLVHALPALIETARKATQSMDPDVAMAANMALRKAGVIP